MLTFSLAALFPTLAPHVVAELDRSDLDALFAAQQLHQPGPLGENATRDFVLRHVFEVDPALIKSAADLLRMLLRRHYRGRVFPSSLDDRLICSKQRDSGGTGHSISSCEAAPASSSSCRNAGRST
ncbi:MAG: hypothetical protein IPK78_19040 [Rhodospirillales bacterium]|nr:hypothetical protein [Rhodospirillales bacterium]